MLHPRFPCVPVLSHERHAMASSIERLIRQRERAKEEARRQAEKDRIREAKIRQKIKDGCRGLRAQIGNLAQEEGLIVVVKEIPTLAISPEEMRQVFVRAAKKYGLARASGVISEELEEPASNGQYVGMSDEGRP